MKPSELPNWPKKKDLKEISNLSGISSGPTHYAMGINEAIDQAEKALEGYLIVNEKEFEEKIIEILIVTRATYTSQEQANSIMRSLRGEQ